MLTVRLAVLLVSGMSALVVPSAAHAQCAGEDCEVVPPPSSAPATRSTLSSTDLLWPAAPPSHAGVVERPYLRRGKDVGLIIASATVLSVGMAGALVIGGMDQIVQNCFDTSPSAGSRSFSPVPCDSAPLALVPLAGGILSGTVSLNGSRTSTTLGAIVGPLVLITQLVGLSILLFAIHGYTEDIVPSVSVADVRVQVLPYASASEGGLSVAVEL